jgi:hypothetical protein
MSPRFIAMIPVRAGAEGSTGNATAHGKVTRVIGVTGNKPNEPKSDRGSTVAPTSKQTPNEFQGDAKQFSMSVGARTILVIIGKEVL